MGLRAWNVAVLVAVVGLWLASGTQKEKPVLSNATSDAVRSLEADAAAQPNDPVRVLELARAYLDSHASGHAVALIESSPASVRADAKVEHLYARALVDQGRNQDALAAERNVLKKCSVDDGCDSFLLASATRRAEILQSLVNLGVEDSLAQPEASAVAYHAATREARVVFR
jgi:predicted Zn-dependent protease